MVIFNEILNVTINVQATATPITMAGLESGKNTYTMAEYSIVTNKADIVFCSHERIRVDDISLEKNVEEPVWANNVTDIYEVCLSICLSVFCLWLSISN